MGSDPLPQVGLPAKSTLVSNTPLRHLLLPAAALLMLTLLPEEASACSCAPREGPTITPQVWLNRFDGAAFRGRIVSAETLPSGQRDGEMLKLTFRVEEHWKGVTQPEVVVWTDAYPSSCATGYLLNDSVIIFAYRRNGRWEKHMCDDRIPAPSFDVEKILGKGLPPPK